MQRKSNSVTYSLSLSAFPNQLPPFVTGLTLALGVDKAIAAASPLLLSPLPATCSFAPNFFPSLSLILGMRGETPLLPPPPIGLLPGVITAVNPHKNWLGSVISRIIF